MARLTWIPLSQLQIGMYVTKLDCSWWWSPFIRPRFMIQTDRQVDRLRRAGIQCVEIDLERSHLALTEDHPSPEPQTPDETLPFPIMPPVMQLTPITQRAQEYAEAAAARRRLEESVGALLTHVHHHGTISADQMEDALREITIVVRTLSTGALFMAVSQQRDVEAFLRQHALSVCTLSLLLGHTLAYNPLELNELATAALLHDLSLLQLPSSLLKQHAHPTALSPDERRRFESHPVMTVRLLQCHSQFSPTLLHLIDEHHVHLDGSGYPSGRYGEFLPERTRVLGLLDRYDDLLTGFGGNPSLTPHHALQRLYQEARNGHWDITLVARFIKLVGIYPIHSTVRLTTHEIGIVTDLRHEALHEPIVTLTHDSQGHPYPQPLVVNLAEPSDSSRAIAEVVPTILPLATAEPIL